MTNQLIQYLRTQFPTLKFVTLLDPNDKQEAIVVRPTGGTVEGYPMERIDATVQIIVRSQDRNKAQTRMNGIYLLLKERFDFTLPAVPTLSLPEINCAKFSANQYPGEFSLEGGVYGYVCNFTATFSDKTP